ncbi:MAG TPA: GNAT family N-acetyltransferase [Trebonia sp.]
MADQFKIRPITSDEYGHFRLVQEHAFASGTASPGLSAITARQFEQERSLAAFDPALPMSEALVGTTGVFGLRMTVPGAALPVAGVTLVSVLPSHRRRGVLRSLMHRQLTDIAARGEEPIAALWASETPIYARYGYGRATTKAHFRFERAEGAMAATVPVDTALTLRLVEPQAVRAELAKAYQAVLPTQPGFFARSSADWWARVLHDAAEDRHGLSPLRCVLAEDGSGVRGYALYATAGGWDDSTDLPVGSLVVREAVAADPAAGAALWHNLLTRDLIVSVTAGYRSAEDPLLFQLFDQRRARVQVSDGLWVRIIDLAAALTRRAYSGPVDVVLDVTDKLLAANSGRWRLRASTQGQASCERTDEPADLAVDIRELGAAYLGGTRLGTFGAAGLVRELTPGALVRLSSAMTWDPAPWCPQIF